MSKPRRPLVIAHAACAGLAPENTLAGIRKALELGVDAIEVDVHTTADDVPILLHDDTLERTTDRSGDVRFMSFAEVRQADAGFRLHQGRFQGEPVPTLAEALELTTSKAYVAIEIKQMGIEEQVVQAVREANARQWVDFCSFFPETVRRLRELEPDIRTFMLVQSSVDTRAPASGPIDPAQPLFVHYALATPELVETTHSHGGQLWVWTVDDEAEMRRLAELGVDGIATNYPDRLLRVLGRG